MKRNRLGLLAAATLVLAISACGSDDSADPTTEPDATEATAATDPPGTEAPSVTTGSTTSDTTDEEGESDLAPGTYKLGLDVFETGPLSFAGVQIVNGAQAAVDAINESGELGVGVTIELVKEDNGFDPAKAVQGVTAFADGDVTAVACCYTSGIAGPIKPVATGKSLPIVGGGAAIPDWTEPPYIFSVVPLNGSGAYEHMVQSYMDANDPSNVTLILAADNPGMVFEVEDFLKPINAAGLPLTTIEVSDADSDFSGPATEAVSGDPDFVIVEASKAAVIIKALRDQGYEGAILSNAGLSTPTAWEQSGGTLENVFYPENNFLTAETPMGEQFLATYEATFGQTPDTFASYGWQQVQFFVDVLTLTQDGSREQFTEAMGGLDGYDSVWGPMTLENGQGHMTLDTPIATFDAQGNRVPADF